MILVATGSRWWSDRRGVIDAMESWFGACEALWGPTASLLVMHGACPESPVGTGADFMVDEWAVDNARRGVSVARFPADWDTCGPSCPKDGGRHRKLRRDDDWAHPGRLDTYCPSAGPRRNQVMIDTAVELLEGDSGHGAVKCVAFLLLNALNSGTRSCTRRATKAGIQVDEHWSSRGYDRAAEAARYGR
jgi:hypothetical protein